MAFVGTLADSGVGESVATNSMHRDNTPAPLPYQRTFSQHFHQFVQLCMEMNPQQR